MESKEKIYPSFIRKRTQVSQCSYCNTLLGISVNYDECPNCGKRLKEKTNPEKEEPHMSKTKLQTVTQRVKKILETSTPARDSNETLYLLYIQNFGFTANNTYGEILAAVQNGIIPTIASVSRASRKCQELYPSLRGEAYLKRQAKQEQFIELAHQTSISDEGSKA